MHKTSDSNGLAWSDHNCPVAPIPWFPTTGCPLMGNRIIPLILQDVIYFFSFALELK